MVGAGSGAGLGGLLENANPLIYQRSGERPVTAGEEDDQVPDSIDDREIFDLIRSINDPEHPLTLEELNVVEQVRVKVNDRESTVAVEFTPTIPHCSMATLIGLSIKVKLIRSLPERFKMDVHITPGTHASEHAGEYGSPVPHFSIFSSSGNTQERMGLGWFFSLFPAMQHEIFLHFWGLN
ncbi:cytosolic iron-sulfur assembly component 2B isoform X1 [Monodelphis domestica]|uniref:cytosolic iron-sulfur assembly component 2B isoform X1 n=1 Tax=Monodelphis domestica TaxID=13616 RepID=UPI0024E1E02A|nr:cytosolic iron-sulfur assembly component 2B isoform X1 [Monodelphis domestica]